MSGYRLHLRVLTVALLAALGITQSTRALSGRSKGPQDDVVARSTRTLQVPVEYYALDNGLKVVLSVDRTTPTAVVALYYHVGFRNEPRTRTGFAHLFEHLMFQGSEHLGKMEFIRLVQSNGGVLNGSTRFDFTNYFEVVPVPSLRTVLWAEADRMRGLAITQENLTNQKAVVINEVKANVLNQPYGGFPWLDLPQKANRNWHNAHNFYGDLADLEASSLEDVRQFFHTYYAPNNAALVVVGDIDVTGTRSWIREYFSPIPSAPPPPRPDISEPRQELEQYVVQRYPRAPKPGMALGYHAPPRASDEYLALGLIDQILSQGKSSRLYQSLVLHHGFTDEVSATLNPLGSMFSVEGPTLYTISLFYDRATDPGLVLAAVDHEIAQLQASPVDRAVLELAQTKMRSTLFDVVEGSFGFGRADLLASFALFFDDPRRINRLEARFAAVTPEMIQTTAREYLRATNRTILVAQPGDQP